MFLMPTTKLTLGLTRGATKLKLGPTEYATVSAPVGPRAPVGPSFSLVAILVSVCGIASAFAQQATFRSGVDLVTVDATVLGRDGHPVEGLGPDDFILKVDGRPRRVVSTQFVSTLAGASRARERGVYHFTSNEDADAGRLVVVAVDEAHIRRLEGRVALRAAATFIDSLDPADRIAVTGLARLGTLAFSRDRVALKSQLDGLVGQTDPFFVAFNIGISEALAIADGGRAKLGDVVLRECGRSLTEYTNPARAADTGGGRDACPEQVEQEARAIAQHARTQASLSINALEALMAGLREIEGPKTVVLLSEGLVAEPRHFDFSELGAAAQAARVSIYVLQLEIPTFEAAQDRISPTFMQDIQTRGDGLARVAGAAKGAFFRLVGGDPRPFDRIARELAGYYLLAFEPTEAERDSRVHRIEVSLARGGGELRARQAFKLPATVPSPQVTQQRLVDLLRAPRVATELPIRVATYTYFEPESPKLRVVVSAEAEAAAGPASRVLLGFVLLDERGVIAASAVQQADSGRYSFSAFVPPGDYTLRVAAIDPLGRHGSVERPFGARVAVNEGVRVSDLILAQVPKSPDAPLQPLVDRVPDPRVLAYIELYADESRPLRDATVRVEVVSGESANPLVAVPAELSRRDARWSIARALVPINDLPPGRYVARAEISIAGKPLKRVVRPFTIAPATPRS